MVEFYTTARVTGRRRAATPDAAEPARGFRRQAGLRLVHLNGPVATLSRIGLLSAIKQMLKPQIRLECRVQKQRGPPTAAKIGASWPS
jgi:hypothetical protein